jgi:hypothetical protein
VSGGTSSGSSPEHLQAVALFDQHLAAHANLTAAQRQEHQQAAHAVIGQMSVAALQRLNANVAGYRLFPDAHELSLYAVPGYASLPVSLRPYLLAHGAYNRRTREVEIDGGGRIGPFVFTAQDRYAHELGHAIDGPAFDVSDPQEWQDAWRAEIAPTTRSPAAQVDHREGFATFAGMAYGTNANRRALETSHPLCVAVWRRHGLW